MCLYNVLLAGLVGIVLLWLLWDWGYQIPRKRNQVRMHFEILAALLESSVIRSRFFSDILSINGNYKGRKAGWICNVDPESSREIGLYIEPNCKLKIRFTFFYPHPTKQTVLSGNKIYFVPGAFQNLAHGRIVAEGIPAFTREEINDRLQELAAAAEIVETDPSYPKK